MSAGTLVGRQGQALKSKLIPLGLCQAEHPDAKIWAQPLAPCRQPSGSMCCFIEQFALLKEVRRRKEGEICCSFVSIVKEKLQL